MNAYEIPELDPALCATHLVAPVTKWGTRRRSDPMPGTWHCYTHDYKFKNLYVRPERVIATGCRVAVEPNHSTTDEMPVASLIHTTYCKRYIATRWQQGGVRVIVDLNVCKKAREINLIGVPHGWTAYATRAHRGVEFWQVYEEFCTAAAHAGTDQILFVVFGGGRKWKGYARQNGWPWVPEHRQVVQGLERDYA